MTQSCVFRNTEDHFADRFSIIRDEVDRYVLHRKKRWIKAIGSVKMVTKTCG